MKSYVISASLGAGCYRHIRIGDQETLDRLHELILDAFDFDDDHAHAFLWMIAIGAMRGLIFQITWMMVKNTPVMLRSVSCG